MTKQFNIYIECNRAYMDPSDDYYGSVSVRVLDEYGSTIWRQSASESLSECPEDVRFCRDLNDPTDVVDLLLKIIKDDPNYNINIHTKVKE